MKTIKNERVIMVDVDDTLVMHDIEETKVRHRLLVDDILGGAEIQIVPNLNMIRLVREEHARGSTIVVWSKGGFQWAENVVKALDLENCVTLVMTKPTAYFDDKEACEWIGNRVYLTPDTKYKLK